MPLNNYFDIVFAIYLEKRAYDWKLPATGEIVPGCLKQIGDELGKHNIKSVLVPGVDGELLDMPPTMSADKSPVSKGDLGCTRSHLSLVKHAKENRLNNYFVFESDVLLHPDFSNLFPAYMKQVPDDWDMIYLGGNHDGGFSYLNPGPNNFDNNPDIPFPENVIRLHRTFTTHAIAVKHTIYDDLINVLSNVEKVDIAIASLHSKYNCYGFRPHLAWQRTGYSDILQRLVHYDHLKHGNYSFDAENNIWKVKKED